MRKNHFQKTGSVIFLVFVCIGMVFCDGNAPSGMYRSVGLDPALPVVPSSNKDHRCSIDPVSQMEVCFVSPQYGTADIQSIHGIQNKAMWFVQEDSIWERKQGQKNFFERYRNPDADLKKIYAASMDNAWAVGSIKEAGVDYGFFVKWDGIEWKPYAACLTDDAGFRDCNVNFVKTFLKGVQFYGVFAAGSDDVWLVGSKENRGRVYHIKSGLLRDLHYDGPILRSIWGSDRNDVHIVGDEGKMVHWNGAEWDQTNWGGANAPKLVNVWGRAANDVYAVGAVPFYSGEARMLHFNGTKWSQLTPPRMDSIDGVWSKKPNDVYMLGQNHNETNDQKTQLIHFDGTEWKVLLDYYSARGTLSSIWANAENDIYLTGTKSNLINWNGKTSLSLNGDKDASFSDIWGSGPQDIHAIGSILGSTSLVSHFDGQRWKAGRITSDYGLGIFPQIWGSASDDVYAIHAQGMKLFHYDGTTWSLFDEITSLNRINNGWQRDRNDVYVVGNKGLIRRYNGKEWITTTYSSKDNTKPDLMAVSGSSKGDVYIVGDGGTILRYDGNEKNEWFSMTSNTTNTLNDVFATTTTLGTGPVYAVGNSGTILQYTQLGQNWTVMKSGTESHLFSVWASAWNDVYAVGDKGTLLHYNGTAWSPIPSGTEADLRGIWGSDANNIYVVGFDDVVLHITPK